MINNTHRFQRKNTTFEKDNQLLEAALNYARLSFRVVPCHTPIIKNGTSTCSCRREDCGKNIGKHPRIKNWAKEATTDEAIIRKWWGWWPDANVGILTGEKSGIAVLDIDPRNGGEYSLEELEDKYGKIPDTLTAHTGGGGKHFYFKYPTGKTVPSKDLAPGLEIGSNGRMVVVSPSLHYSGKRYIWEDGEGPETATIAPMPEWLIDLAVNGQGQSTKAGDNGQGANYSDRLVENPIEAILLSCKALLKLLNQATNGKHLSNDERIYISNVFRHIPGGREWLFDNVLSKLSDYNRKLTEEKLNGLKGGPTLCNTLCGKERCPEIQRRGGKSPVAFAYAKEEKEEKYEPLSPEEIFPPTRFPYEVFPEPFINTMFQVSDALMVPYEMPGSAMLSIGSGCIGNNLTICSGTGFKNPPFLWLIFIAPSGEGKSPVINTLTEHIKNKQREAYKRWKDECFILKWKARKKEKNEEGLKEEPKLEQFYCEDFTIEALANVFEHNPRGLVIPQDELAGLVLGFNQYKIRGNDLQYILTLWNAGPWKLDRAMRGTRYIPKTGAAIVGGIQTTILARTFKVEAIENGLLPRFMLLNVEAKARTYTEKDLGNLIYWEGLIDYCYEIQDHHSLILSEEAELKYKDFYNYIEHHKLFLPNLLRPFVLKYELIVLRIAGMLHILYLQSRKKPISGNTEISEETMHNAIKLANYFIYQAILTLKLYQPRGEKFNEEQKSLIKAIFRLEDKRTRDGLLLEALREKYNEMVPKKLQIGEKSSKRLSALLKSIGLETKPGLNNKTFLQWDEKRIRQLFDSSAYFLMNELGRR